MIDQLNQLGTFKVLGKMNELVSTAEENFFFPLAYYKDQERIRKREFFSKYGFRKVMVVTSPRIYCNVSPVIKGENIETISDEELSALIENKVDCRNELEGSIVILNNNNVAKIDYMKMASLIEATPNTLFVIHDFDNHHWHDHSVKCALFADIYAPAHLSDFAIVGRINPVVAAGIPCGSIQWTKQFLIQNFSGLVRNLRSPEPLGLHTYYPKFIFRNSVISTVSKHFKKVGFPQQDFLIKSDLDRWTEWINYPVHWIAPVFNDLPLRFFDSLISGGMPLVPIGLRPYLEILGIPKTFYICYGPTDLTAVEEFVRSSIDQFNFLGEESRLRRHLFALEHFHVDEIIYKLYSRARDEYIKPLGNCI